MVKIKDFAGESFCFRELEQPEKYARFIKWAPKYADKICVTGYWNDVDEIKKSPFAFLYGSIVDCEFTSESAVTISPDVIMLYLKIDHITMKWLREKKNVYDFNPRSDEHCLDDLCFVRDGRLVMASCTHEHTCYISAEMLTAYRLSYNHSHKFPK